MKKAGSLLELGVAIVVMGLLGQVIIHFPLVWFLGFKTQIQNQIPG